ncbi:MAG: hypothetical protein LBS16_08180 [Prevotellaceae bacterium]|jgi:tetratricopeptide (TPR) repeat protein|nr:hypothetical protein [Prevotellaceae bacterium]
MITVKLPLGRYLVSTAVLLCLLGCSTKKNTWSTRTYHSLTTRYNVHFNANNSYKSGIDALNNNHKDDYSRLLPLFPISNHDGGKAISSQMDVTVEKCRKAIKLHSIKKKPQRKSKRMRDSDYKNYYNQEEFNPQVKRAWLLLGEAEFHKADFIGAVGTFSYIMRHFSTERTVVAEARIRMAKSYAEMGWLYEAEDALGKIDESALTAQLNGLFAAAKADLLLKEEHYKEAIPFLLVACEKEKSRYQKTRFEFVLGQLYEKDMQNRQATAHFLKAKSLAPNYEMRFNAELRAMQSDVNSAKAIKALQKMAKNSNNKNYLDQIYTAIGNQYLAIGQEEQAIESFKTAITLSTRNGIEKAVVALLLGDIYYNKQSYTEASSCYDTVVTYMPNTHIDYPRASRMADILGELVFQINTIQLQDSLLHLSTLSREAQMKVIDKIIADVVMQREKAAADSVAAAAMAVAQANALANTTVAPVPIGMSGSADWYFYNSRLMTAGKSEFAKKWGRRNLEDNWRRQNKAGSFLSSEDIDSDEAVPDTDTDTVAPVSTDELDPAYYLAQIPTTEAQKRDAHLQIADALYQSGGIYLALLHDDPRAEATYRDFQRRYPADERKVETYYYIYQIAGRAGDTEAQNVMREKIITEFPDSKYATILSQPDYLERLAEMNLMQDSLYRITYQAYSEARFDTVEAICQRMLTTYPLSELMPKFAFLNALKIGKTESHEALRTALTDLVTKYPDSDVASISKDILALIAQGKETAAVSSEEETPGSLVARRNLAAEQEVVEMQSAVKPFSGQIQEGHVLVLIPKENTRERINELLYDVAAFNFSKFMIKDFDLELRILDGYRALVISKLESREEALWYEQTLLAEPLFQGRITYDVCERFNIAETDLLLIGNGHTIEDYINYLKVK